MTWLRGASWALLSLVLHGAVLAPFAVGRHREARDREERGALVGDGLEPSIDVTSESVDEPSAPGEGEERNAAAAQNAPPSADLSRGESDSARGTHEHVARASHRGGTGARGAPSEAAPPVLFGAVGERSALDLATAFTRGFPQTASADSIWAQAPFGDAGTTTVRLEIDESGQLVSTRLSGAESPALRRGVERTIALLRGRTFVARGRVTTLHLHARISPDEVHDGLHGDVFALGGSFQGGDGSAFFALAIGRRIDLVVRASP